VILVVPAYQLASNKVNSQTQITDTIHSLQSRNNKSSQHV